MNFSNAQKKDFWQYFNDSQAGESEWWWSSRVSLLGGWPGDELFLVCGQYMTEGAKNVISKYYTYHIVTLSGTYNVYWRRLQCLSVLFQPLQNNNQKLCTLCGFIVKIKNVLAIFDKYASNWKWGEVKKENLWSHFKLINRNAYARALSNSSSYCRGYLVNKQKCHELLLVECKQAYAVSYSDPTPLTPSCRVNKATMANANK